MAATPAADAVAVATGGAAVETAETVAGVVVEGRPEGGATGAEEAATVVVEAAAAEADQAGRGPDQEVPAASRPGARVATRTAPTEP